METSTKAILIIDQSINLEDLYKEVKGSSDVVLNELTLIEYVDLYSSTTGIDIRQAVINIFVTETQKFANNFNVYLEEEQFNSLNNLACLFCKQNCGNHDIVEVIGSLKHCLPLNILNMLNQKNILCIETFLKRNINNQNILKEFLHGLQILSLEKDFNSLELSADLLSDLINHGYSSTELDKKALRKLCQYLLHKTFDHIFTKLSDIKDKNLKSDKNIIKLIRTKGLCTHDVLKTSLRQQLIIWVTRNPTLKVSDAISQQSKWKYCSLSTQLVTTFKEVLLCIGTDGRINALKSIIEKKEINWKNLLTFVSVLVITFKESIVTLDEIIVNHINFGLTNQQTDGLVIGFLLVRQISLEGQHIHCIYSDWYQKHFTSGTKCLIKSSQHYKVLIKFLTSLVPCEPAQYLKVHISNQFGTLKFSSMETMSEYVGLARTRLADLKEVQPVEEDQETVHMVENVVQSWEKTLKIPKVVMEASIFRKQFFLENFIPILLKPRTLPDEEDAKMKLISVLVKQEKIPKPLYAKYLNDCEKEKQNLIKSFVEMDVDEVISDDEIIANLKNLIVQFITNGEDEICQKIHKCFYDLLQEDESPDKNGSDKIIKSVAVDLTDNVSLSLPLDKEDKIVKTILEAFSNLTVRSFEVLQKFLLVTSNYQFLKLKLCQKIWEIKEHGLDESLVQSITWLLLGCWDSVDWKVKYHKSNQIINDIDCLFDAFVFSSLPENHNIEFLDSVYFQTILICNLNQLNDWCWSSSPTFLFILKNFKFAELRLSDTCCSSKKRKLELKDTKKWCDEKINLLFSSVENSIEILIKKTSNEKEKTLVNIEDFFSREIWISPQKDFLDRSIRCQIYEEILFSNILKLKDLELVFALIFKNWNDAVNLQIIVYFCENIVLLFKTCENNLEENIGKWFLNLWENTLLKEFHDVQYEKDLSALVSLLSILPSNFLFLPSFGTKNTEQFSYTSQTSGYFSTLEKIVNIYLCNKPWSSVDICDNLISSKFISYIMQGALETISQDEINSILRYMIVHIPLLFISLLVHWKSMTRLQVFLKSRCPHIKEVLTTFSKLISAPDNNGIQQARDVLNQFKLQGKNELAIVVCVCALVIHQKNEKNSFYSVFGKILENFRDITEIYASFMTCVIAISATMESYNSIGNTQMNWFVGMIDSVLPYMDADVILNCLINVNPTLQLCFSKSVCDLYYFSSGLRIICLLSLPSNVLHHLNTLQIILQLIEKSASIIKVNRSKLHLLLSKIAHSSPTSSITSAIQNSNLDAVTKSILKTEYLRRQRRSFTEKVSNEIN